MVMVWVPALPPVLTVIVIADVPEPGAAMELWLKVIFWVLPCPEADKVTAELKPLSAAVVIVEVPDFPGAKVILAGDAVMVKSALAAAVTVRLTVAVCVTPPPVPVTVIG